MLGAAGAVSLHFIFIYFNFFNGAGFQKVPIVNTITDSCPEPEPDQPDPSDLDDPDL
jgi:hypothetical protein